MKTKRRHYTKTEVEIICDYLHDYVGSVSVAEIARMCQAHGIKRNLHSLHRKALALAYYFQYLNPLKTINGIKGQIDYSKINSSPLRKVA